MDADLQLEPFFTREAIQEKVSRLAERISSDYMGQDPVLVGILNGAVFFFSDLVRQMTTPVKIDFIRAASYGSNMESSGSITLTKDIEIPVRDRPLILVEDIVDTGLTLSEVIKKVEARQPRSIKVCALIDKRERRKIEVDVDYAGFRVSEGFFVGYGLDCNERYRQLPDIHIVRERPQTAGVNHDYSV